MHILEWNQHDRNEDSAKNTQGWLNTFAVCNLTIATLEQSSFCTIFHFSQRIRIQFSFPFSVKEKKKTLSCSLVAKEHSMRRVCSQMMCIDSDVQSMSANDYSMRLSACTLNVPSQLRITKFANQ